MDTVLIILGVLGLGTILVSAYVFTVAARNYVSEEKNLPPEELPSLTQRSSLDRRSGNTVQFPLTVNGILIPAERRRQPERRAALF